MQDRSRSLDERERTLDDLDHALNIRDRMMIDEIEKKYPRLLDLEEKVVKIEKELNEQLLSDIPLQRKKCLYQKSVEKKNQLINDTARQRVAMNRPADIFVSEIRKASATNTHT